MRFKTVLLAVLAASLVVSGPIPSLATASRDGSSCAKAGTKNIYGGVNYVCTRLGMRTVWKKLAAVRTPSPKPIASGEPNPSSSPSSNRNAQDALWLRVATNILDEQLTLKPAKVLQISFIDSPTSVNKNAQQFRDSYRRAMTYWSNFVNSETPAKWVVVTEKDRSWWSKTMQSLSRPDWDSSWWGSQHCDQMSTTICGAGDIGKDGEPLFTGFVGTQAKWTSQNTVNALHEATHVYQMLTLKNYLSSMPCWYSEGEASFFGIVLGQKDQPIEISRGREMSQLARDLPESTLWDAAGWANALKEYEVSDSKCHSTDYPYSAGYLVIEKLLDQFGHAKLTAWEKLSASSQDWKASFASVFGLKVDDWYRESAGPYIDSQAY